MGTIDFDISEFENPRPAAVASSPSLPAATSLASPSSDGRRSLQQHVHSSRPKTKKLPYRADVVVEGRRYKGKRVSRGEADLDVDALGLVTENPGLGRKVYQNSASGDELDPSVFLDDSAVEDSEVDDDDDDRNDNENHIDDAGDDAFQMTSRHTEHLKEEERAVAARLIEVEKKEVIRAHAVRKQKEVHDAVVNLRIRLEPLMSLARQFPSHRRREELSAWSSSEELQASLREAEASLTSLLKETGSAWSKSWASEEDEESEILSDTDFEKWRDAILDRWGAKVNEASGVVPKGGFRTIDTTVSAQMKASLASGKHLNRTRRVRQSIPLLGDDLELPQGSSTIQFDDGDFYRTLLREVIESGEATGGGLRYAQLSRSGKVKKKRDRSFAKGRRLKYKVHEKLVGFLAPVPLPDPGPLDEIIAALFGKRGTVPASS